MAEARKRENRIIVAQDGSLPALAAANIAIQIARVEGLSVEGLYVVDETLALDPYVDYRHDVLGDREVISPADLVSWLKGQGDVALQLLEARCLAAGVPTYSELVAGGVVEMVLRACEEAEMLAIGRRGQGHEDTLDHLGRSFRAIAHRASLPIVIGGNEERVAQRLLLAYKGDGQEEPLLSWASRLQQSLGAEVLVVAIEEEKSESAGCSGWLADAEARLPGCRCLYRQGQPAVEIVAAAEEIQADLILMGRYRHPPLMEWIIGSTVDRVLRATRLPVLMV